jgi:glycosyltransferase involved in cell wall biosynthesis
LFHAARLAEALARKFKIELTVVGRVDGRSKNKLKNATVFRIRFMDVIPPEQIPWLMRSSHVLFSAEVNPPCPNSVIEALACGLPVIGFDTGSLAELVQGDAGRLALYGANEWKLEQPDVPALVDPAIEILQNQTLFRKSAREQAEAAFGVDKMVDEYSQVLLA